MDNAHNQKVTSYEKQTLDVKNTDINPGIKDANFHNEVRDDQIAQLKHLYHHRYAIKLQLASE